MEIDKLKFILFNKEQEYLFNKLPKPVITDDSVADKYYQKSLIRRLSLKNDILKLVSQGIDEDSDFSKNYNKKEIPVNSPQYTKRDENSSFCNN